jgi:hypothetical protein
MPKAWYKPFHEPDRAAVENNTPEGYSNGLRAVDDHDLRLLDAFWRGELKALKSVNGSRGEPLASDLEVATTKLARITAEINRRKQDEAS